MGRIRFGCQTYTWQMSGKTYLGQLDRIIGVAARAGFTGLECEMQFLGKLRDPARMREVLDREKIAFASLCIVQEWRGAIETESERAEADFAISYLAANFPGTILNICPLAVPSRNDLTERQKNHLACINAIATRAAEQGVAATYHPNSVHGSTCITPEDYAVMLNGIDSRKTGWCPDIYHIRAGHIDPVTLMREFGSLINHVHYSDLDRTHVPQAMGEGNMDFARITRFLVEAGYAGWLVVEDHCKRAETDPDGVTMSNGRFFTEHLKPLIQ